MKNGFIKLHRKLQDCWIWQIDKPFDERSAWIDLLLSVNHEEKKIKVGCSIVAIKPGQMWTSYKKLAQAWGWSYNRVKRFIKMLESDGMIYVNATANGTSLTIVNWGNFTIHGNTHDIARDTPDDIPSATPGATPGATQTIMNKNVNNDKERKEKSVQITEWGPRQ